MHGGTCCGPFPLHCMPCISISCPSPNRTSCRTTLRPCWSTRQTAWRQQMGRCCAPMRECAMPLAGGRGLCSACAGRACTNAAELHPKVKPNGTHGGPAAKGAPWRGTTCPWTCTAVCCCSAPLPPPAPATAGACSTPTAAAREAWRRTCGCLVGAGESASPPSRPGGVEGGCSRAVGPAEPPRSACCRRCQAQAATGGALPCHQRPA